MRIGQAVMVYADGPHVDGVPSATVAQGIGIVVSVGARRIVVEGRCGRDFARVPFDAKTGRAISKYRAEFLDVREIGA